MRALMAPCLVIYGGSTSLFQDLWPTGSRGCFLWHFYLAIIYLDFYGKQTFTSTLNIQLMLMMNRVRFYKISFICLSEGCNISEVHAEGFYAPKMDA